MVLLLALLLVPVLACGGGEGTAPTPTPTLTVTPTATPSLTPTATPTATPGPEEAVWLYLEGLAQSYEGQILRAAYYDDLNEQPTYTSPGGEWVVLHYIYAADMDPVLSEVCQDVELLQGNETYYFEWRIDKDGTIHAYNGNAMRLVAELSK